MVEQYRVLESRRSPAIIISILGYTGIVCLASSVLLTSTVLAFIGLGLTFWAAILIYIRPRRYVRSDLLDSTALPSLQTIDRIITALGFTEKAVYIPQGKPSETILFVPSRPLPKIPVAESIEKKTLVNDPKGIVLLPPGLALAKLIEDQLGVESRQLGLDRLSSRLTKLVIEDLEIAQDFDMRIDGSIVRFKFAESIYSELCIKLKTSTSLSSSIGCPISSALACIVAHTCSKPVALEEDMSSGDDRPMLFSCRILED